ncbi:MAG: aldo/keto reductase, partial [Candidatus Hydrogenedentales bacterium]
MSKMKYRRFGKTELQIPVISCGGMRFQQSWNSNDEVGEESQRNLEATIRRAFELGINHFETARGYGTSEAQLGKILPKLPRERIIVQTKVGPTADPKEFADVFDYSMSLLQLDHVDLFAFHGINNEEVLEHTKICLDTALRWKKEGRIRNLGFSTHAPCDTTLKTIELGVFDYVNLHYYFVFQDNWPAVQAASKHDMGVFI